MVNHQTLSSFIQNIPKAELHVHIEGTLQPELLFKLAERNGVKLSADSPDEMREKYNFNNLQDFLDLYHEATHALLTYDDFYDLSWSYFKELKDQNVRHAEIFIDTQTHTDRGIKFETVVNSIHQAAQDARKQFDLSISLIVCFLRHKDESDAFETLRLASKYKDKIIGIGLASSELGHPPSKFQRVFEAGKKEGFRIVAHAGEEGPPSYIWEALELLDVERIDHGNRSMEDPELLKVLAQKKTPLTMCPLSNLRLCVIDDLKKHPAKKMMDQGITVTIHSDDPAYFGGNLVKNYVDLAEALQLNEEDIISLAKNSFNSSFLSEIEKERYILEIDDFLKRN